MSSELEKLNEEKNKQYCLLPCSKETGEPVDLIPFHIPLNYYPDVVKHYIHMIKLSK